MIDAHVQKRSFAISAWIVLMFLAPLGLFFLADRLTERGADLPHPIGYTVMGCVALGVVFWFKAHYHWSRAKGYSGWLVLLALLGFPIAPIVFACIKDQAPKPPPVDSPIQKCPHCGAVYRLSEYNPDAQRILCSACKGELPRT